MTTVLLVRHALCDTVGVALAGRRPGIHLNAEGVRQAEALAGRLSGVPLAAVVASPRERARETAAPVAARHGLAAEVDPAFDEIDFGRWTGCTLDELEQAPAWREFNRFRSGTRIPGGETMLEVQRRAADGLEALARRHPGGTVAVVSHADVLRAVLVHLLGMPLDHLLRLEVSPASVSVVTVESWGPRVLGINLPGDGLP